MIKPTRTRILISAALISFGAAVFARPAAAAEAMRYRVSYGGTAGYQLPLWVNRELGLSKKHGLDLETMNPIFFGC